MAEDPVTATNIKDIFAQMMQNTSGMSEAGSKVSAMSIFKDINAISEMSSIETEKILSYFSSSTKKMVGMVDEAQGAMKAFLLGDYKAAGETMSKLMKEANISMTGGLKAIIQIGSAFAGIAFDTITLMNQKIKQARIQGVTGVIGGIIDEPLQVMRSQEGPMGKLGGALTGIIDNVTGSIAFLYTDYLAKQKAKQRGEAQLGTGRSGAVAAEMPNLMNRMGVAGAEKWTGAMANIGITDDAKSLYKSIQTGLTMQMDASEVTNALGKVMAITDDATAASNMLQENFRAMQKAAEGTNTPVKLLATYTRDALANARFMNVDMKTLGATMQFIAGNADKMKAMGMSMRADSGNMIKSLTDVSKISDSMFAYFGTKGGTEGSPIEGLIKAKFGEDFQKNLKSEAGGGFTSDKGAGGGSMMEQRLEMMKNAMMEAGKSGTTDSEKLLLQMKVATDTFQLGPEAAKLMAMTNAEGLADIAKDPALADQFKDTNTLLSEQKTLATVNESIQRAMSQTSIQQLGLTLSSLKLAEVVALQLTGADKKAVNAKLEEATTAMQTHLAKMGEGIGTTLTAIMPVLNKVGAGKELTEAFKSIQNMVTNVKNPKEGSLLEPVDKAGNIFNKAMGWLTGSGAISGKTTTEGGVTRSQAGNSVQLNFGLLKREEVLDIIEDEMRARGL